jgi:hypothetical protein
LPTIIAPDPLKKFAENFGEFSEASLLISREQILSVEARDTPDAKF